ncbi:MAG: Tyrosine--tRNA ligase [Parcubacteria group bacterium]|nr:Tyrosine--tRNA ligase [Parcubacteria group bacterium]
MNLADELKARGLIEHTSADLEKILSEKRVVYIGADPTADSLHVGHLSWVLLMKRLGLAGHSLIFLVGGGTGMIGDPKEKGERPMLDVKTIKHNVRALDAQLRGLLGRTSFRMVNNADWLLKTNLIDFLRDIGKHFTVNDLIKRDTIKRRLETADESISYTEFTYALLQGYDYLVLNKKYGTDLQVGASDQWTNILSGVDLIRKREGKESFALTIPLVTDAAGKKFGKTEGNAVWLSAEKTSPYAFYQFWLNQPDEVVGKYLKFYTFMSPFEIDALMELHGRNPGKRDAQKMLAKLVTEIVHGTRAANESIAVSEALFGERELSSLSREEISVIQKNAPYARVASGTSVIDALIQTELAPSKSEARRLIEGKGVSINGVAVTDVNAVLELSEIPGGLALIKRGKQAAVVSVS